MITESTFRIAFWILLGGLLVMRGYFAIQVRQAGERLLPDEEARGPSLSAWWGSCS
jgi:hypothetical protein